MTSDRKGERHRSFARDQLAAIHALVSGFWYTSADAASALAITAPALRKQLTAAGFPPLPPGARLRRLREDAPPADLLARAFTPQSPLVPLADLPTDDGETWRVVPGWEAFAVSDQGRVARRLLAPGRNPDLLLEGYVHPVTGYRVVTLRHGERQESQEVYTLVWRAFAGDAPPRLRITHVNETRTDDRFANLALITYRQQTTRNYALGYIRRLEGERNHRARLTDDQVRTLRSTDPDIPTHRLLSIYGVSYATLRHARQFRTWRHVESFRPVVRWEGDYLVSNLGRVQRLAAGRGTYRGRFLGSGRTHDWYQRITLSDSDRKEQVAVRTLVRRAFPELRAE